MKFKIVHPFVLNQKTYNAGEIVSETVFLGQEKVQENFLHIGFIQEVSDTTQVQKVTVATRVEVPSMPVKPAANLPKPIEIRNFKDLQKVVEEKPVEAPKPPAPVEEKPVEAPKPPAPVEEKPVEAIVPEEAPAPVEEKAASIPVQQTPRPRGRVSRN